MKKLLFILSLSLLSITSNAQAEYSRAKIYFENEDGFRLLENLGLPTDHGLVREKRFVISDFSFEELELARNNGFIIDILIEDVKAFYKNRNRQQNETEQNPTCPDDNIVDYATPSNFNQGSMGGYLTYQELLNELDDMAAQFPNLITSRAQISNFLTEGTPDNSVTPSIGGNPIYWLKISDNPNTDEDEPEILYDAIHHAREPMSLMNLVFYMWYLLENYETDPAIQDIVDNTELYFVPVINPDGYLYNQVTDPTGGGLWRKNRKNSNGVDNNRNYNYFINGNPNNSSWGGPGSSSNPNSSTYHGTGPFSEVENQAMKWFVEQHDFTIALNNHTFGRLLYYPFGYADVATPDDDLYQALGAELTSQNGYSPTRDSPFAGDSDDFMYGTVGTHEKIFAFTPEIGSSFWPPASAIESTCRDMMYLNLTAARMVNNYAQVTDTSSDVVSSFSPEITFDIKRLGLSGNGSFSISIGNASANITNTGSEIVFSNLEPLEFDDGSITISLDENIEEGDEIVFDIIIDNGTFTTQLRVTKVFGYQQQVFYNNGDNSTDDFNENDWGVSTATFVSPSSSITDSPGVNYSSNQDKSIVLSEAIDLTAATLASVRYYARWNIEATWDYVQFEISKDGGATWEPQCGNFTKPGTNIQPSGEPIYDGFQNDWIREDISLSDYIGETIVARFRLVTDGEVNRDGFYVDDLEFLVSEGEPLNTDTTALEDSLTLYPNPVKDKLLIKTAVNDYEIEIVNLLGQKVKSYYGLSANSEIDMSSYNQGIYFVRVLTLEKSSVFKIIKR